MSSNAVLNVKTHKERKREPVFGHQNNAGSLSLDHSGVQIHLSAIDIYIHIDIIICVGSQCFA